MLLGATDKIYEVTAIEKFHQTLDFATVGDGEVGLYVDGMADLTEVSALSFLYEEGNIPERTSSFVAELYLRTQDEGGRQNPVTDGYKPTIIGIGLHQQATVTLISHVGAEDSGMWMTGETVLAKVTLTDPVPTALLSSLEFTMGENTGSGMKITVDGKVVDSLVEADMSGNTMLQTDTFNTEVLTPAVVKITNTREEAFDHLGVFVSTGNGGGNYLTDFTLELYDANFNLIEGTFNNTTETFTKDDSSTWSLSAKDTCYVVIKTTNAASDVFVRLM